MAGKVAHWYLILYCKVGKQEKGRISIAHLRGLCFDWIECKTIVNQKVSRHLARGRALLPLRALSAGVKTIWIVVFGRLILLAIFTLIGMLQGVGFCE